MSNAGNIGTLRTDLTLDSASFVANVKKATAELNSNVAQMKRSLSSVEKNFELVKNSVSGFQSSIQGFLGFAIAGTSLQAIAEMADNYKMLQGRIQLATEATGDYSQVSNELARIATQTGSTLQDNVDVFQRLATGAKELGRSNSDVLQLVKIVDQLGSISGASGSAMQAGLLQFGQAMGAGVVRAEEFNSILENIPALADRIAKGLGVSTGALRQMVLDGKLLSKDVFEALLKQSGDIEAQFNKMPMTISRGANAMGLSFSHLVAEIDKASGGTRIVGESFKWLGGIFDETSRIIELSFNGAKNAAEQSKLSMDTLKKSLDKVTEQSARTGQEMIHLGSEYDRLSKNAKNSVADHQRMVQITEILASKLPMLNQPIDVLISKYGSLANAARVAAIQQAALVTGKSIDEQIEKTQQSINAIRAGVTGNRDGRGNKILNQQEVEEVGNLTKQLEMYRSRRENLANELSAAFKKSYQTPAAPVIRSGRASGGGGRISSSREKSAAEKEMETQKHLAEEWVKSVQTAESKFNELLTTGNKLRAKNLIDLNTYNRKLQEGAQNLFGKDDVLFAGGKTFTDTISKHSAEAIEKLQEPHKKFLEDFNTSLSDATNDSAFQAVQQVIQDTMTPLEKYNQQVEYLNYLHEQAGLSTESWQRALVAAKADLDGTSQSANQFAQSVQNAISQFGDQFFNTLINGTKDGKAAFSDFVSSALLDLSKLIFKLTVTIPLANALSGALGGNKSGGAAGAVSNAVGSGIFAGIKKIFGFADGGMPPVGKVSLVGERGPELFVPKTSGTIIPNEQLGRVGGGGAVINVYQNYQISTGVVPTVQAEIARMMPEISRRTQQDVRAAIGKGGAMARAVGRTS